MTSELNLYKVMAYSFRMPSGSQVALRDNGLLLLNFIVHTTIGVKRSYRNKG